jgi:hypothetical protein
MKLQKMLLIVAVLGVAMSGGIHRVMQSRFNNPDFNQASALNLYFMLDNAVGAGGFMMITAPTGVTISGTACNMWALGDSADAPLAGSASWMTGTLSVTG